MIIKISPKLIGNPVPSDFVGLSFETASLLKDHAGVHGYFFDSTNTQLINLFHVLGIKNIRIGGGTVDDRFVNPTRDDIDAFFSFVKAAGVKVIYSFRLLNGDAAQDASVARYIWDNYKHYIDCFSIGNEPDWPRYHERDPQIFESSSGIIGSAFPSYLAKWKAFAKAIRDSVPDVKFGGPDTGSNYPIPGSKDTYFEGKSWTVVFADSLKNSDLIKEIYLHNYTGQDAPSNTVAEMVDKMLSST